MTAPRSACPRVLMAAGGTGGHVYPALAIADAIVRQEPTAVIEFAGTQDRMEWTAVPKGGYAIHPITAAGISRSRPLKNLGLPFSLGRGLAQSMRLVADFDADVVVGTGGYVTGPVGLAAAVRGRPLVLQEQNAYPGVTNRLLGRFAARVHVAFEEARSPFRADRCELTGNPVRPAIGHADRADGRKHFGVGIDSNILLVFGGSLGSQALNEAVAGRVADLLCDTNVEVIWQTGNRYHERIRDRMGSRPGLRILEYIDRMDLAYAAADVVLCRSGAITCSELLVTGSPSILVPSPNVAEDHQTRNAESMIRMGVARLLPEGSLAEGWLGAVRELLADAETRAAMTEAAKRHAVEDAAERIASDVLGIARGRRI